jgi:hypothetical protein
MKIGLPPKIETAISGYSVALPAMARMTSAFSMFD